MSNEHFSKFIWPPSFFHEYLLTKKMEWVYSWPHSGKHRVTAYILAANYSLAIIKNKQKMLVFSYIMIKNQNIN